MPSRETMQASFAAAIWAPERDVPAGISPQRNFAVYRNNVYAGLIKSLQARFPVVQRLVGDEFFARCAGIFVERQPPLSPVMMEYGADFPGFLAAFEPIRHLPYLAPVAELEWQYHVAQHGPDAQPLDTAALATLPLAEMDRLTFSLHPTCHILASPYPILSIWRTNTFDTVTQEIAAGSPGETVMLVRPHNVVLLLPLTDGIDVFVTHLQQGTALAEAAALAQAASTRFDLAGALALLFRVQALSGFHAINAQNGNSDVS
mgnify:CR=1 FL=1|nr:DNA-binding domain-containing protein [uncultured Dongia sp.]